MPTVWVPALLRKFAGEQEAVQVPGSTLGEAIDALEAKHAGIKERLCVGNDVRPGLAVVIDTQVNREGLSAALTQNSEVHFIPAIGGGQ